MSRIFLLFLAFLMLNACALSKPETDHAFLTSWGQKKDIFLFGELQNTDGITYQITALPGYSNIVHSTYNQLLDSWDWWSLYTQILHYKECFEMSKADLIKGYDSYFKASIIIPTRFTVNFFEGYSEMSTTSQILISTSAIVAVPAFSIFSFSSMVVCGTLTELKGIVFPTTYLIAAPTIGGATFLASSALTFTGASAWQTMIGPCVALCSLRPNGNTTATWYLKITPSTERIRADISPQKERLFNERRVENIKQLETLEQLIIKEKVTDFSRLAHREAFVKGAKIFLRKVDTYPIPSDFQQLASKKYSHLFIFELCKYLKKQPIKVR